MLRIHILDVGHGDSIVLERCRPDGEQSFAVIDSNGSPGDTPRALKLLESLGAKTLSFAAITHPHADHYMGMQAILTAFAGQIEYFYTFPIKQDNDFLKKAVTAYMRTAKGTDNQPLQKKLLELAKILAMAGKAAKSWETPNGIMNRLAAPGFDDVRIFSILPPARVKGEFFDNVLNGRHQPEASNLNELSVAFLVEYGDHQVILGGDGTKNNWHYQGKRWSSANIKITPAAVKLPHHGSSNDCDASVQNILFGPPRQSESHVIACISANGKTHPSPSVIDELVSRGIRPYCTNLAKRCGNNIQAMVADPTVDAALMRFINAAASNESHTQPCQGDIVLEIQPGKPLTVQTQHKHLCGYRGEYDFLATLTQH